MDTAASIKNFRLTVAGFELAAISCGDADAKRLAVVLPGFLDTITQPHIRAHVEYLAGRGYLAVAFDAPGIWGSSGAIADYTMTQWLAALKDVVAQYDRPTLTIGHSRGGTMALQGAIEIPHVWGAVAIMSKANYGAGSSSFHPLDVWRRMGEQEFWVGVPGTPGAKRHFVVPYSVMEDAARYDLRPRLAQLTKPKLFIAGDTDVVVAPQVVREGYDAAADPKQYVEVSGGHLYRRDEEQIEAVNAALGAWLDQEELQHA